MIRFFSFTWLHRLIFAFWTCFFVRVCFLIFLLEISVDFPQSCDFSKLSFQLLQWYFWPKYLIGSWTDSFTFLNSSYNLMMVFAIFLPEYLHPYAYSLKSFYPSIPVFGGLSTVLSTFSGNDWLYEDLRWYSVRLRSE